MTMAEALDWLSQKADASGECDRCHAEGKALWALPSVIDPEPDAAWLYCAECYRRILRSKFSR